MSTEKESDNLKYRGGKAPLALILAWSAFFIFAIYYLATFMWPDLKTWNTIE